MRTPVALIGLLVCGGAGWCATDLSLNGLPVKASAGPRLSLCDGLSKQPLSGRLAASGPASLAWQAARGDVTCSVLKGQQGQASTYRVTVAATAREGKRLLRLRLAIPVAAARPLRLWDGYEERAWDGAATLERENLDYTFPLGCVCGGQQGLALGLTPDTLTSSLHCGVRSVAGQPELFYESRLVVDAAHPQTITFVTYRFEPTFGYLDAVQGYYDLFPAAFRPTKGVDPRVYGVGGYIISSYGTRRLQLNSARRALTNWEWCYAPWVRSGDWYPEKSDWVEGTDVIRQYSNYRDESKGTWEQYHEARTQQFIQGDKTCAMFYYVLVKDINRRIVEQYPTARLVTEGELRSGKRLDGGGMAALLGEDTLLTSAYGTPLAARLENEVRRVVANYEVSGFAFDMANHAVDDYGPGQANCGVGRTFDDEGNVYSPDTVSAALLADAIHKLSRDGKRMGVIMNQAISRSCCFAVLRADAVMYENLPNRNPQNVMPLRLMSGRKPFTFWNNLESGRTNMGIRWEQMDDPKAAAEIRRGLSQHTLFTCLRIGATPMNRAVADVGREWMPTLIELKRRGWNPAPAVLSTSPDLWIGRFGAGDQTILTITNPKRIRVQAELTVLNRYLGGKARTFVSNQGQTLRQRASRQKTVFRVDMAPKEIMVLRARPARGPQVVIPDRDRVLNYFTEADALANPIATAIVVGSHATRAQRAAADMIESYFANYEAYRERPNDLEPGFMNTKWETALRVPIVTGSALPPGVTKCLRIEPPDRSRKAGGRVEVVERGGRPVLSLSGGSEDEVQAAVNAYLKLLDSRYIRGKP
jgi:hypothetical protein